MNSKLLLAATSYLKDFNTLLFGSLVTSPDSHAEIAFQTFMADYNKNYPTTEEYSMRFAIFKESLEFVENHPADASF
jgi:hypothetical protein